MPNPYVIGGVALVIAVLGWQLKVALKENGVLEANLVTANAQTNEAADANETLAATIEKLKKANATMVEERRIDTVRREKVLDERERQLATVRAEAARLKRERDEAFNENPDCTEFAGLNVELFCPLVGSGLRERSTSQGSH